MKKLDSSEKVQALTELSRNKEYLRYFEQYIANITGNISVLSLQTVITLHIKDLEKLLYRSFLEGILSKELEIKENIEKIYNEE